MCRILCRFPLLSLARAQEPEDPEKAVGTQPGARERFPNEPPHPYQGRSQCTLLALPPQAVATTTIPKEPICTPDPETQASSSWDSGVCPQCPGILVSLPPASPGLLLQDLPRCPLRVHILSLINVQSVSPPFCLCVVVCGHQRTGWEAEAAVLSPPPPPPGPPPLTTSFLPHLPKGSSFLCTLVPICVPQTLRWRPPPSVPHVLPFPSSHPCLWGLETREEMTEPLWSPPACVLAPGHTLRPEAAPTRYSDTSVWRPWART